MPRKFGLCLAIVQEVLWRNSAFESGKNVLRCDAMSSFVENDWNKLIRVPKESQKDADFGNRIIGTTGVSTYTSCSSCSREQNDGIAKELDVGLQSRSLLIRELGFFWDREQAF